MLTVSPSRIVRYVPAEARARGAKTPVFKLKTPTGRQRTQFFSAFRGAANGGELDVDLGALVCDVVSTCLVGWDDLTYDDPADEEHFGERVPFDAKAKLEPLSQSLIGELFRFIQDGCRLTEADLLPLESVPPSRSDNSAATTDTGSNVRTT